MCRTAINNAKAAEEEDNVTSAVAENEINAVGQAKQIFEYGSWNLLDSFDTEFVTVEGKVNSEDYPYGYNIGAIEDDEVGKAILVTPGTSIQISGRIPENVVLSVDFKIHPWVAQDSDGAVINFDIKAEESQETFSYEVTAQENVQSIDLSKYARQNITLMVSLSNKDDCNEDCDWTILQTFILLKNE